MKTEHLVSTAGVLIMNRNGSYKRHWSFVVTDKKYIYPFVILLTLAGFLAAIVYKNPEHFSRVGNLIVAVGVWISMRYTLREGINKYKNHAKSIPVLPDGQVNSSFFNEIAFSIGDARLQLHGLYITIYGSIVGSFGDLLIEKLIC